MSKKVVVTLHGIPHFYAVCYGSKSGDSYDFTCPWTYEDYSDRETGYKEIRKHVRETGHEVHLEMGVHTNYGLETEGEK